MNRREILKLLKWRSEFFFLYELPLTWRANQRHLI